MEILDLDFVESAFIDYRNISLWNSLKMDYNIGVVDTYSHYELKYLDGNSHVVIFTDKTYNRGVFTHELLHLRLRNQGFNSLSMYSSLLHYHETYIVRALINLLNNIEHILFFDDFIEMGFKANEFVMDYSFSSYNEGVFQSVKLAKNGSDKNLYIVYFLSTQITMLSEEYTGLNRFDVLQRLKNIDPIMYNNGLRLYNEVIDFELKEKRDNDNQVRLNKMLLQYLPSLEQVHQSCVTPPVL